MLVVEVIEVDAIAEWHELLRVVFFSDFVNWIEQFYNFFSEGSIVFCDFLRESHRFMIRRVFEVGIFLLLRKMTINIKIKFDILVFLNFFEIKLIQNILLLVRVKPEA